MRLSKTRLLNGLQCKKRLWLEVYKPHLAEAAAGSAAIIQTGIEVGTLAQSVLAPGGRLIDRHSQQALDDTRAELAKNPRSALYEATFEADDVMVRTDLLWPEGERYRIVEVKSSSRVKKHYLADCAIQWWVLQGAGYQPQTISIAHINKQFMLDSAPEDASYDGLFALADLTEQVADVLPEVSAWVAQAKSVIASDQPVIAMGPQCNKPHSCPFIMHCSSGTPVIERAISKFPSLKINSRHELIAEGYQDIGDVPDERAAQLAELRQPDERERWEAARQGKAWYSSQLSGILGALEYPRYYLDFESISFTVPRWPGTQPFEHLPFQWSVHIEQRSGKLDHDEFLDVSGKPPMRALTEAMISCLGNTGPIIVFTSYERTRLRELAKRYPDLSEALQAIIERLFDLHPVLKHHYYHPEQNGSFSIKSILPCVLDDSEINYQALEGVRDGLAAQHAYLEAINPDTSAERREEIRRQLLEYCKLDTLAPLKIINTLQQ